VKPKTVLAVLALVAAVVAVAGVSVAFASKPQGTSGKLSTTHGKPKPTTTHGSTARGNTTHGNTTTHGKPSTPPGKPTTTTATTGQQSTNASPSGNAKAYGYYCRDRSKERVDGQKGTPFSQCVTAMAKAAHGQTPKAACAGFSKKHTEGDQGTPFSRCVASAAKLIKDEHKP
jgi:uncharacterized protein YkwD